VLSTRGKTLNELCIHTGLRILNGRISGDFMGEFTCFTPNGSSVVDYFISSESLINFPVIWVFRYIFLNKLKNIILKFSRVWGVLKGVINKAYIDIILQSKKGFTKFKPNIVIICNNKCEAWSIAILEYVNISKFVMK
jgi:hypothetical protein